MVLGNVFYHLNQVLQLKKILFHFLFEMSIMQILYLHRFNRAKLKCSG
jgi:hypothetical protein